MKTSDSHRVAVTGFGGVTALGIDIPSTWESVMAGRTARGPITAFPTEGCRVAEGAQAQLPEISKCSPKQVARMSRAARLAIPACHEALHAAGLLGLPVTELLFVGDSETDVLCARAAGCPVVCVADGYNHGIAPEALGADRVIQSFLELLRAPSRAAGARS